MGATALVCVLLTIVAFVLFARLINESEKTKTIYLRQKEDSEQRQNDNQKDHLDLSGGLLGI